MVLPSLLELIQKVGDMEHDLENGKFQKIAINLNLEIAFGVGLTRCKCHVTDQLAPPNATRAAYVAMRKLPDPTPKPTKAARFPPPTFALDELASDASGSG
ncbi:hypothetical protein GQ44DRAFT_723833 [Phaeosphaeriaceae sp. PMI808]|nr:hypothetical protein GQ44DRAFT_723833 [Phaeosphaeriaceae sp. PMI808]